MMEGRVLVIECEWRIRRLIRANLEALGLEVREAISQQQGLELLGEGRPDLILLDLELPGVDLPRLAAAARATPDGQPAPIVVLSADPPARHLLDTDDVAGHLQKPFAASALLDQVRRALNGERQDVRKRTKQSTVENPIQRGE